MVNKTDSVPANVLLDGKGRISKLVNHVISNFDRCNERKIMRVPVENRGLPISGGCLFEEVALRVSAEGRS